MLPLSRSFAFAASVILLVITGATAFSQTITLSIKTGPPTSKVAVSGTGFPANSAIDIYFDTTDLALTAASGTGTFSKIPLQVPSSALPGAHYITAIARTNSTAAQIAFVVSTSWAQFGFAPTGQRNNPYENVLAPWNVGQMDIAWMFPNSLLYGAPVEAGGTVYVGSYDSSLYAINETTGATVWSFGTGSLIAGSPAVAGGNVYFGSADGNIYAVNAVNGQSVWTYPVGSGIFNSLTVANGAVYAVYGGTVLALNAKTGALLWSSATGGSIVGQAAVAYGLVFVDAGSIYALNASNGALVWSSGENLTTGSPVTSQGLVYANFTVDYAFGGIGATKGNYASIVSGAPVNSFTAANGTLYTGNDVYVTAFSAAGSVLWNYTTGGTVNSTPAVADGVVYVGSDDGNLYVLNAISGSYLWSYNFGFANTVRSSPIVANGMVFLTGPDGNLYAFAIPAPPKQSKAPSISQLHPDGALKIGYSK